MGYSRCKTAFVVAAEYALRGEMGTRPADVDAFRQSLPEQWRSLVIGPVKSLTNGYSMFAFLWDGSKEGWGTAEEGAAYRKQFLDLFSFAYEDGSSPYEVLSADFRWGGDEPGAGYGPELEVTSNAHCVLHPHGYQEVPE